MANYLELISRVSAVILSKYLNQVNWMKSGCCKNCNNHKTWNNFDKMLKEIEKR